MKTLMERKKGEFLNTKEFHYEECAFWLDYGPCDCDILKYWQFISKLAKEVEEQTRREVVEETQNEKNKSFIWIEKLKKEKEKDKEIFFKALTLMNEEQKLEIYDWMCLKWGEGKMSHLGSYLKQKEKCGCHRQCGCDRGECNCYDLKQKEVGK